jgi:hypothetical protein
LHYKKLIYNLSKTLGWELHSFLGQLIPEVYLELNTWKNCSLVNFSQLELKAPS